MYFVRSLYIVNISKFFMHLPQEIITIKDIQIKNTQSRVTVIVYSINFNSIYSRSYYKYEKL